MTLFLAATKRSKFDPKTFLSTIDGGRKIAAFPKERTIFAQGDSSDAVFLYTERKGKSYRLIEEREGSHASILNEGDFFGEGCLIGQALRPILRNCNDRLLCDANR